MAKLNKKPVDDVAKSIRKLNDEILKLNETNNKLIADNIKGNEARKKQKATIDNLKTSQKNLDTTTKSLIQLDKQLEKSEIKLTNEFKQLEKAVIKKNEAVKRSKKETQDNIILESKESGTLEKLAARNRRLREERLKLNLETKKGKDRLKEINGEIDKNNVKTAESSDKLKKQKAGFLGLGGPIAAVNTALKALLANPVVAVMAAIVAVFALFRKAMTRSEEGQDRLNKIMTVANSVWDNLLDIVTIFGTVLFDTFPKLLQKVGNRFTLFINGVKIGFLNAQIALAVFLGQAEKIARLTDELNKTKEKTIELKQENENLNQSISEAFDSAIKKAGNLGKEIDEDIRKAKELADITAQFNKDERKAIVENAELVLQSAKLRAQAELLKKIDAESGIALLEESFDLDEKVLQSELRLANTRADILQRTSDLASDTIEDKKAIAEAEADVFAIETRFEELRRQRVRRLNILRLEAFKQEEDRQKARIETEKQNAAGLLAINESIAKDENKSREERVKAIIDNQELRRGFAEQEFQLNRDRIQKEKDLSLKSEEDFNIELASIQAKKDAETVKATEKANNEVLAINNKFRDAEFKALQADVDREAELREALFELRVEDEENKSVVLAELRKLELEEKIASLQAEFDAEEEDTLRRIELATLLSESQTELKTSEVEAEEVLEDRRRSTRQKTFDLFKTIFGKQSIIGKALFALQKASVIADILLNLQKEKAAILASFAGFGILAPALAAPFIAAANFRAGIGVATVAATTIKGFVKGTKGKYDTPDVFRAGEGDKRELVFGQDGSVTKVDKETIFTGMKNSLVVSNPELKAMASKGTGSTVVNNIIDTERIVKAIKNKETLLMDKNRKIYGFIRGGYKRTYI